MIPEGPLYKMVPLTEDHGGGVHGDPRYLTDWYSWKGKQQSMNKATIITNMLMTCKIDKYGR